MPGLISENDILVPLRNLRAPHVMAQFVRLVGRIESIVVISDCKIFGIMSGLDDVQTRASKNVEIWDGLNNYWLRIMHFDMSIVDKESYMLCIFNQPNIIYSFTVHVLFFVVVFLFF